MKLAIVVAHSSNRVIGRNGALPWHLPGDLRHFKELTTGNVVIMGRKTYESLPDPYRPLPNRVNIVVSRTLEDGDGYSVAPNFREAVWMAGEVCRGEGTAFIIGGQTIYLVALGEVDEIFLTLIEGDVDGDAHFPVIDPLRWAEVEMSQLHIENGLKYRFIRLERVRS